MAKVISGGLPEKENNNPYKQRLAETNPYPKVKKPQGKPDHYAGPSLTYEQVPSNLSDI
jgi:hypothetical protein